MYFEEYVVKSDDEIRNILDNTDKNKVVCLTTGDIFNSMVEASIKYNVQQTNISACCRGKQRTAGHHLVTNESLRWQYYSEYIKDPSILSLNNK